MDETMPLLVNIGAIRRRTCCLVRTALIHLTVIVLVVITVFIWRPWYKKELVPFLSDKPSIAIMYFKNNTGDEGLDYWRTMLSNLLTTDLTQSRYMRVLGEDKLFEILTQLDNFCESKEYLNLKQCGVTFYSDLVNFDKPLLREKIIKLKSKSSSKDKKRKIYLNKNVKLLINIVKTYAMNGKLDFNNFQKLARDEEIIDHKFNIHFNQACYLGYLKKQENQVLFLMDYC